MNSGAEFEIHPVGGAKTIVVHEIASAQARNAVTQNRIWDLSRTKTSSGIFLFFCARI
jgi:hypothetical protein